MQSLCAFPFLLFCSSSIFYCHQCWQFRAINNLIIPTPSGPLIENEHHQCHESFLHTTSYATKLAMMSAWQTMNSRAPVLMDYAPGSKAICIDTGASSCISNDKHDFITYHPVLDQVISGISLSLNVEGHGTLRWIIRDDNGDDVILHISDALYVPKVPKCLPCPQQVAKQTGKSTDGFLAGGTNGTFTYDDFVQTVPYNGRNDLLLLFTTDPATTQSTQTSTIPASCTSNYVQALLSTEIPPSFTNLSRVQRK